MNCQKYFELIPLYLLNDIDTKSKEELELHLKSCPQCQKELDEMRTVISSLEDVNIDQMTDSERLNLQNEIFRSIIIRQPEKIHRVTIVQSITRVAAVVVIFLGGYFVSSIYSVSEQEISTNISSKDNIASLIKDGNISLSDYRFSKEGLKVIAKGRQAMNTDN